MTEKQDLRNRLVVGRKRDGRREFDETARRELVELCLKPGVSIARTAMDHDVNPNQLRKWIASHQQRQLEQPSVDAAVSDGVPIDIHGPTSRYSSPDAPSAFVPVVPASPSTSVTYACPCCDLGIKVTPAPPRIIPRGLLSESALAWIATGKYQFGMPLYRQAGLLRRFGGDISSNTIAVSMVRVGLAAQPVINLMRDALLDAELIYCDETTLQVLKEEGRRPQSTSYLWAQMSGSGVPIRCFTYTPGRGTKLADKLFTGIREGAVMMTDGYEPYNDIAQRHRLVHLGCWVHVRRYFVKAEDNVPKAARTVDLLATRFIKLIGKLFAAESRSETWATERRQRLRRRYSARVLDVIHALMLEQSPGVVPKSLLGKGLTYLREQWPKLVRYVENGSWPISNNPCENAICPFCVGRRGWLFSDTVDGANASANLYTLVESAKANGIDPYRYLTWMFQRLPLAKTVDDYDALLPWKMPAELR
ncbi:IS66 family transposase [Burkholderia stabilis]|uniref:IS66 family transposase n=1 Tax=Burkholderia stabilis TaxID=95485 RepID=A0A4Q2A5T8_9BURK|nr:IS66 family transposase [Burkholderia stabilis]